MTFGSLFTGIGGMDLGLERAGMSCRWQVEIDQFCQNVLVKRWPNVTRFRDIRELQYDKLESVDLICGGFPCQPFSSASAGKRRGIEDDRYLWPEMRRVIQVAKPTWVIGENVTHIDGPALEQVVSDLEKLNYEVAPPFEVPACAFGYDHKRSRYWIIGYSDSNRKSGLSFNAEASGMPQSDSVTKRVGTKNGISKRLDRPRLKALGNAVVPDIMEWLGRGIMEVTQKHYGDK